MKKLFFFKSSSSSNGTGKHIRGEKETGKGSQKGLIKKLQSEESDVNQVLRRSRSMSLVDGTSSNDLINATRSNQHRHRTQSSRFKCFTPDRQSKEAEPSHMYKVLDSSGSLSTCSSLVLDRYIDGEEKFERSKQKSCSSSHIGSIKGRRLPPRVRSPSPLSDTVKNKQKSKGTTRLDLSHNVENGLKDTSPRALARSVVERLSQNHGSSKASSKTLDSNLDVFANLPLDEPVGQQELFLQGQNRHVEGDADSELEWKFKEAEKRVKLLSEDLEEQKFLSDCDFDISSLVGDIRQMEEERAGLAYEVLSLLRSQMDERASSRKEIRRAKSDCDLHIKKLEKEKNELQFGLEKEFDTRSSEWTSNLENIQMEDRRLRERVRELAEHNVSLQREVSTFHEKETERIDMIKHMEETVTDLNATVEEMREENVYLMQNLSKLQENYTGTSEDLECLRRNFEEKDLECRDLHKSIARFVRMCNEQEKTIQGLRDCLSEEFKKQPSEMGKKIQMEQIRLTGVEFSLRKEVEAMKLDADSLRRENLFLLERVKRNGEEVEISTFKLDNVIKMRVCHLQDQGVSMLSETTELCYKLLKFLKEKLAQFPGSYQDTQSMNNGLSEQFLIESEMRVHGLRRGTESLKRSLETVNSLLLEKMSSNSELPSSSELNNHSEERILRAELKAETLVTSLLREKLYSMEQEIEQLKAEVAAGIRGNEVLQCEVRNTLDNLSIHTHQLKDLKLQMLKKDEKINRLETNLQEGAKELTSMKVTLPKVLEESEMVWKEVKECRERNMNLESEKEVLKKKIEKLEEDTLFKEGQITILKDTLGSKHFDLLSSPDFTYDNFLVH